MATDQTMIGRNPDGSSIQVGDLPASYSYNGPLGQVDTITYGPDDSGNFYAIKLVYSGTTLSPSQPNAPKLARHIKEHGGLNLFKFPRSGPQRIMRQSRQSTATGFWAAALAGPGSAGANWHCQTVAHRKFYGVELGFSNPTGSSITFDQIAVAATADPTSSFITPNGGGAWTVKGALTVTATGSASAPGFGTTGFIPLQSIDRTDGGKYPAWMWRVYTSGGIPSYSNYGSDFAAHWDDENSTWPLKCANNFGGDYTSTNQSTFTSTTRIGIIVPTMWRPYYDTPGIMVLGIGDSIAGGDYAESGVPLRQSYLYRAVRLLQDRGLNITHVNCGQSGNTTTQFAARALLAIDFYRPDIVVLPVWTPNDSPLAVQADFDAEWYRIMQIADYALASGAQVMLVTPTPYTYNTTLDALRLRQRDRALASGFTCLDLEPITSDRATPARWLTGYSADGTHPLKIANIAISTQCANTILTML